MAIAHPEHAAVNLVRLVDSLRKNPTQLQKETWVQVRSGRQTVKYARELYYLVRSEQSIPLGRLHQLDAELSELEKQYDDAVESHPVPSSSKIPYVDLSPPSASSSNPLSQSVTPSPVQSFTTPPAGTTPSPSASLSLPPSATSFPTLVPPPQPLSKSLASTSTDPTPAATATLSQRRSFVQDVEEEDDDEFLLPLKPKTQRDELLGMNEKGKGAGFMGASQLHEELSGQLAQMSRQLKSNAVHFSKSLEDEKGLLESSSSVLEGNLEKTRSSKSKLSAVSQKTRGTTWLTLLSIAVVILGFFWTLLLIRMT